LIASQNRLSFGWTEWVPFVGGDFKLLPTAAGIYRVRIRDQNRLAYIGQTGRNLRERLSDLRRNTLAKGMPFNARTRLRRHYGLGKMQKGTNTNVQLPLPILTLSTGRHWSAGCYGSTDSNPVAPHSVTMGTSIRTM
jgi:hypothetical protein